MSESVSAKVNDLPVSISGMRKRASVQTPPEWNFGDRRVVMVRRDELDALLDIAEAAQRIAHDAEFYADDDTPEGSLIVVPRDEMKALDEALAKVRP